jgi:phosphohistidine phosphatase
MDLILWRHAEAEDGRYDLPDAARQLTKKGRDQAAHMAKWLNKHMPDKPCILASPSVRTQQTADALAQPYTLEDRLFTTASVDDYLAVIRAHHKARTLMLVGHQPLLGELASLLLCGEVQPWSVEKGSIWWLRPHGQNIQDGADLVTLISPALL